MGIEIIGSFGSGFKKGITGKSIGLHKDKRKKKRKKKGYVNNYTWEIE